MSDFPEIPDEIMEDYFGVPIGEIDAEFAEKTLMWRDSRTEARSTRKTGCNECPVREGMYTPYAKLLTYLPPDRQSFYLDRWWCHTDTRFCCNGAREYVEAFATPHPDWPCWPIEPQEEEPDALDLSKGFDANEHEPQGFI